MNEKHPSQLPALIILAVILCVAIGSFCYMLGIRSAQAPASLAAPASVSPSVSPQSSTQPSAATDAQVLAKARETYAWQKRSGCVILGIDGLDLDHYSELTVTASSDSDYYVLVKYPSEDSDTSTDTAEDIQRIMYGPFPPVYSFYVCAGQTCTVKVPQGPAEVRFATGSGWAGPELYFGPDTQFYTTGTDYDFTTSSYELTLYPVENGNLKPQSISADEFNS